MKVKLCMSQRLRKYHSYKNEGNFDLYIGYSMIYIGRYINISEYTIPFCVSDVINDYTTCDTRLTE